MKIIITGGSGFIGSNLLKFYLKKEVKAYNLDIQPPKNKEHYKYWYKVDLANYNNFSALIKEIEPTQIIHLAGRTDLNTKINSDYSINVESVKNIIKVCKYHTNIKRVIFASTMLVNQTGYKPKNIMDYNPNTEYGKSKVSGENIVLKNKNLLTEFCIIRPTSIWGEGFKEPYKNFFDILLSGRFFHPGNKASNKTLGYIGNSIYQIDKLLFADAKQIRNQIFYIGDKPSVNISTWADEIAFSAGIKSPKKLPIFIFKFLGLIGDFFFKIGVEFPMTSYRLRNMITDQVHDLDDTYKICGHPPFDRKDAIERTLKWYIRNK